MKRIRKNITLSIAVGAMLVAMSIILTRLLPIYIGSDKRIAFGDIPIMLAGIWFGPIAGGVVGLIADISGSLISGLGWYPPLTIPAVLVGVIAGLLKRIFLRGEIKFYKVGAMVLIGNIITAMGLNTWLLSMLYGTDFFVLLVPRCLISLGISVAETAVITVVVNTLGISPRFLSDKRKKYMTKDEALKYIHSVSWMGSRPGLSRTRELLKRLGNPQNDMRFIHVAGTNGKGSVSVMLYTVLLKAGVKAGLYTSPFIEVFNERIQAFGSMITDDELAYVTQIVKKHADKMKAQPTEFELITCIAFEYFKRKGVDTVVLEVGMGGELDSTNVINAPEAAVIASMSFDHTQVLGNTMEEIASAKAGIIKQGCTVISYGNDDIAERVFAERAEKTESKKINPDFSLIVPGEYGLHGQSFSYKQYENVRISLIGKYQLKNAALALETVDVLNARGYHIGIDAVKEGMSEAKWPARFELIYEKPVIIVDGAHNPDGIRETSESIKRVFADKKLVFVMGVMADKELDKMLPYILPSADIIYTVTPDNPRAMAADKLAEVIMSNGAAAEACEDMAEAARRAVERAGESGVICALGSLYMAADIKKAFKSAVMPD